MILIKKALISAIITAIIAVVLYQVFWYFSFKLLFQYDAIIVNANAIILLKLVLELLLYLLLTVRFIFLTASHNYRVKFMIFAPMIILCGMTFHALIKYQSSLS
mgnify:CR=1 FL=1